MIAETLEEKEVQEIVQQYRDYLQPNNANVAISLIDNEVLFYYTEPDGEKTSFTVCHNAEELQAVILYELVYELKMIADISVENIDQILNGTKKPDVVESYVDINGDVILNRLVQSLEKIHKEISRWTPSMIRCFNGLETYYNNKSHT